MLMKRNDRSVNPVEENNSYQKVIKVEIIDKCLKCLNLTDVVI